MTKRIDWLDVAKGIAIILVVCGHVRFPVMTKAAIYSFHMPLFFMASGFVLFRHPEQSFVDRLKSLSRGILVPYILFNLIYIVFYKLIAIASGKPELEIDVVNKLIAIFVAQPYGDYASYLWFLPCIFVAKLIVENIRKEYFTGLSVLSFAIFLIINNINTPPYGIPWSMENVFLAIPCMYVGYRIKDFRLSDIRLAVALLILWAVLFYWQARGFDFNDNVEIYCNQYGNMWLFFPTALAGSMFVVSISQLIAQNSSLQWFGRQTLSIYCTHLIYLVPVGKLLGLVPLATDGWWGVFKSAVLAVILLLLMFPTCRIIDKYLPWMAGKGWKKSIYDK